MKKLFVLLLSLLMVATLTVHAAAESNGFVKSPSLNQAPELIDFDNDSEECEAVILVTAYADRDELPEDMRNKLEDAYDQIVNEASGNSFAQAIAQLAKSLGVDESALAVSDLFDISSSDCDSHSEHGEFTITLKSDVFAKFAGILHYTGESWEIVNVTDWQSENNTVTFTVDEFSPFAIIVSNTELPIQEDPGFMIPLGIAVVAAAGLTVIIVIATKKIKKKDD